MPAAGGGRFYHGVSGLLKTKGTPVETGSSLWPHVTRDGVRPDGCGLLDFWTPAQVDKTFQAQAYLSGTAAPLGHGGNNTENNRPSSALAATGGLFNLHMGDKGALRPFQILRFCLRLMQQSALGTLSGGWRIVHTMVRKITKLRPVGGFCAETAGALTLFGATAAGIPAVHYAHHPRQGLVGRPELCPP